MCFVKVSFFKECNVDLSRPVCKNKHVEMTFSEYFQ